MLSQLIIICCLVGGGIAQSISTVSVNLASCPSPSLALQDFAASTTADVRTLSATSASIPAVSASTATDGRYGLAYALYSNPYNRVDDPGTYTTDFLAQVGSLADPASSNFTYITCGLNTWANVSLQNYIDGSFSPYGYLPGHSTLTDLGHIAMIMQGYLLIPVSGTYIFSATFDDVGFYWLGETAFNPWNQTSSSAARQQKRAEDPRTEPSPADNPRIAPGTTDDPRIAPGVDDMDTYDFKSGEIVPIAALWANAGGRGTYRLNITFPNNTRWTDFSHSLLLPLPSDPWVPDPKVTTPAQAASCPGPPPATGDTLCGLTNATGYYHGSGKSIDRAIRPRRSNATGTFSAEMVMNCQAAKNCQLIADGCYFALYRVAGQDVWKCAFFDGGVVPEFTMDNSSIAEAVGYSAPCGNDT